MSIFSNFWDFVKQKHVYECGVLVFIIKIRPQLQFFHTVRQLFCRLFPFAGSEDNERFRLFSSKSLGFY